MAGEADPMQKREHRAACTIQCSLIVERWALVRWPEPWAHITVLGHICLIRHGGLARCVPRSRRWS